MNEDEILEDDGLYEMAYERYLESRGGDEARADLALHESLWPNGYGRCPQGRCWLGIYHPGECEEPKTEGISRRGVSVILSNWYSGLITDREMRAAFLALIRGESHWVLDTKFEPGFKVVWP